MTSDTIVAISTARARAAIGIVRLSGTDLEPVVTRVFRRRSNTATLRDRRPHLGDVLDEDGTVVDEGLLLWMAGPRSYTGEDVVELHCHGNPWILDRVVASCIGAGARSAEPGEFTRRAYLNGRIDLIQADAVAQLISASSERALAAARRLFSGELSRRVAEIRDRLINVLKWLEMSIDFPEEDLEQATDRQLLSWLGDVRRALVQLIESFRQGRRMREGVSVVLCGRPNVGKSSLFNRLLGFRRSIVADLPGTTRDMIESGIELGGFMLRLQDTAGMRDAVDVLEEEGVRITREVVEGADLVLLVVDGSTPPHEDDYAVLDLVRQAGVEWLGVLNKGDLELVSAWTGMDGEWLPISARTGDGLQEVKERLLSRLEVQDSGEALLLTSRWQKEILERALQNVDGAILVIEGGLSPEATAYELYEALDRLDEMRGTDGREEVLNRIFAEFCLGK